MRITHKKRLLALVLAALMAATLLAGCGGTNNPSETTASDATTASGETTAETTTGTDATTADTTASETEATTTEATTTEAVIDFNGYTFLFGHAQGGFNDQPSADDSRYGTEKVAQLQDAYDEIMTKYNFTIEYVNPGNDMSSLMTAVMSGIKNADFINCRQECWIPLSINGYIRPLDTDEMLQAGLDVTNPDNFNQFYTQLSNFMGHVWALDMSGYYDWCAFGHTYAFNKVLCEKAGYTGDQMYQLVRDNEWTYEKFIEIATAISHDDNGDGTNDIWGVALDCDGNEATTNGTRPIIQDETGKWISNLSDPRIIKSFEFMATISGDGNLAIPLTGGATASRGDRRTNFYNGICGFAGLYGANFSDDGTGRMVDDFGMLPMPKGPDTDTYRMNVVDVDEYVCLVSNSDWETSAFIMNAIGSVLTDNDAYLEQMLANFRGDEQALEMLTDYCLPNATLNIEKCSENMYQITRKQLYDQIYKAELSPAAAAETYGQVMQSELDSIFKQ